MFALILTSPFDVKSYIKNSKGKILFKKLKNKNSKGKASKILIKVSTTA